MKRADLKQALEYSTKLDDAQRRMDMMKAWYINGRMVEIQIDRSSVVLNGTGDLAERIRACFTSIIQDEITNATNTLNMLGVDV